MPDTNAYEAVPQQPEEEAGPRRCYNININFACLCLVGFVISIDSSFALISLQAYWLSLGGDPKWSGTAFGLYDALAVVCVPVVAVALDYRWCNFKTFFLVCLSLNGVGNLLYALALTADHWSLILVGRVVAGLGAVSGPFISGPCLVTLWPSKEEQAQLAPTFMYVVLAARMLGPIVSSVMLFVPQMNVFTLPGWMGVSLCLLALPIVAYFFHLPPPQQPQQHQQGQASTSFSKKAVCQAYWPVWLFGGTINLVNWFFAGNLFLVATSYFHLLLSAQDLWKLYCTGVAGFALSPLIYKKVLKRYAVTEKQIVTLASVILGASCSCFLLRFHESLFYVAVWGSALAVGIGVPALCVFNNVLGPKVGGSHQSQVTTLITMVMLLARFAGPSLLPLLVSQHHGSGSGCKLEDSSQYQTEGCRLDRFVPVALTLIAVGTGLLLLACRYMSADVQPVKRPPPSEVQLAEAV